MALSSDRQYPTAIYNSDIQGQSNFSFKETDAALLPANGSPTHSGRPESQPKDLAEATSGAARDTGFSDVNKDMDNGMLGSQGHSHRDTMDRPPEGAEDHTFERRGKLRKSAFRNTVENFSLIWFVLICTMTILRWTLYPQAAQQKTAASVDEISFHAAAPIGFQTLTSLTGIIVSNAYWGGHAWSLLAYVMWWFGMAWILITCMSISASG